MAKNLIPSLWFRLTYALTFASFSAAQTFNLLALFLRFDGDGWSILDPLQDSSYGIYLVHYIPILWMQYALLRISLSPIPQATAIIKALIVFVVTLILSWAATAGLRRLPGATHVL